MLQWPCGSRTRQYVIFHSLVEACYAGSWIWSPENLSSTRLGEGGHEEGSLEHTRTQSVNGTVVAFGGGWLYDEHAILSEDTVTNTTGKLVAAILALVLGALTLTGCGGLGQNMGLLLANIGWDENVAVSNLTKVLLEDELGYESVEIRTQDNRNATYRDVASGELDAFQDVWLPNQEVLLDQVAEEVDHLDPWFLGETKQGMAVPAYMDVKSIPQLNGTDAKFILGIEPTSVMMQEVGQQVIPTY